VCNRYSQTKRDARLTTQALGERLFSFEPRYNIAPTQIAPVGILDQTGFGIRDMRWGLDGPTGQPVMNARSETAHKKSLFRDAWESRHCVVPADGFYEWKDTPEGKQPYRFVQSGGDVFWFAGLWTDDRYTILTAPALGCVSSMHDRMPVILREDAIDWWIETGGARKPEELIERCGDTASLNHYPVTRAMSNARHVSPDCIERIEIAQGEFSL